LAAVLAYIEAKQTQGKKINRQDRMRNNLDGDVTESYRMNMQFMFVNVNDIYRIQPII